MAIRRAVRKCLKCGKDFDSESVGNRICRECHKGNATNYNKPTTANAGDGRINRKGNRPTD